MKKIVHILLIEDDPLDQSEVRRTLDKRGIFYRLTILNNGEEVIDLLMNSSYPQDQKPNLILLDLSMPKMNGLEILSFLKDNDEWRNIKVFVLTASDDPEDRKEAKALGISGYIVKPLKLESQASSDAFNLMIDLMNV
jgi:CheY-like chemotaxis protein